MTDIQAFTEEQQTLVRDIDQLIENYQDFIIVTSIMRNSINRHTTPEETRKVIMETMEILKSQNKFLE
jgi:hypothetical protein